MKKAKRLLLLFMLTAVFFVLPAGQAQAANDMIAQAKTSKVTGGKFVKKSKGLKYRYKEGRYAKNKWHEIGGRIYYFGTDGYAKKGWFTYKKEQVLRRKQQRRLSQQMANCKRRKILSEKEWCPGCRRVGEKIRQILLFQE